MRFVISICCLFLLSCTSLSSRIGRIDSIWLVQVEGEQYATILTYGENEKAMLRVMEKCRWRNTTFNPIPDLSDRRFEYHQGNRDVSMGLLRGTTMLISSGIDSLRSCDLSKADAAEFRTGYDQALAKTRA